MNWSWWRLAGFLLFIYFFFVFFPSPAGRRHGEVCFGSTSLSQSRKDVRVRMVFWPTALKSLPLLCLVGAEMGKKIMWSSHI